MTLRAQQASHHRIYSNTPLSFGINTANIERRDQTRKLAIAVANLAEARAYMKS